MAPCSCGGHEVQFPGLLKVTPATILPASTFLPIRMLRSRSAFGGPAAKCRVGLLRTSANETNCRGYWPVTGAETSARSQPESKGDTRIAESRGTYKAS